MNKKQVRVLVLLLFSFVGALLVIGQDDNCGVQNNPCIIPSDNAITIDGNNYYTIADAEPGFVFLGSSLDGHSHFYNAETQRVEPNLNGADFTNGYLVIDVVSVDNNYPNYNVLFTSENTPQSHAESRPQNLPDSGQYLIQLPDRSEHPVTILSGDAFVADCQEDPASCTIRDSNSYTRDLGEGEDEIVTVRDNVVVRVNTRDNTATLTQNDYTFSTTRDQYDRLPLADMGSMNILANDQLSYMVGDETRTAIDRGWGIEVQRGVNGQREAERYLIPGEDDIERNTAGNWEFRGEEYASGDVAVQTDGSLRLGAANRDRVEITSTDRGTAITEIDVEDGKESSSTTIRLPDGGRIEEERDENGELISREAFYPDGRRSSEDTLEDGQFKGTAFYAEDGTPYGWCSVEGCTEPETTFRWDDEDCRGGGYDRVNCYTTSAPEAFQDEVYSAQLWNSQLGWQETAKTIFGHDVSFYPLANEPGIYQDWVQGVDEAFASAYLGAEYVSSAICSLWWDVDPVDGVGIIRTPQDTFQSVGHVVAERIPAGILLCVDEGSCPGTLECREDQFCYREGEEEPTTGYLYKIDWGVTAPRDEELVGRGAGQSIKFNLIAYTAAGRQVFLFADGTGRPSRNTITVETGERSAATYAPLIAEYSPETFTRICIEWSDDEDFVPQTLSTDFLGGTEPLPNLCSDIVETRPGRTLESATDPTGVSQSRQIRYCTLSGCS